MRQHLCSSRQLTVSIRRVMCALSAGGVGPIAPSALVQRLALLHASFVTARACGSRRSFGWLRGLWRGTPPRSRRACCRLHRRLDFQVAT